MAGLKYNLTPEQQAHLDAHGWAFTSSGEHVTRKQIAEDNSNKLANDAARRAILDGIAARKAAERREEEGRVDRLLAPRRKVEEARWLVSNPGRTAADFERLAWPHVRTILVAELEAERQQATAAALVSTGRYSF